MLPTILLVPMLVEVVDLTCEQEFVGGCLPGIVYASVSLLAVISEKVCDHFAHCSHLGNCDFFMSCKLGTLFCFVFTKGYGRLDFFGHCHMRAEYRKIYVI